MNICAVIPAAGRGARLGLDRPKILAQLSLGETVWSVLRRKVLATADHIHVILSPEGEQLFRQAAADDLSGGRVSMSVQPAPVGMGDAIFCGYEVWRAAKTLLVIWGDQVFVSEKTLSEALKLHGASPETLVLPVVSLPAPYVEYVFDSDGRLTAVRQSREGDECRAGGWNDIGTFVLSAAGLKKAWECYLSTHAKGRETGEINFLPFLSFLSESRWRVRRLIVDDVREARGINTAADLRFFQDLYASP